MKDEEEDDIIPNEDEYETNESAQETVDEGFEDLKSSGDHPRRCRARHFP